MQDTILVTKSQIEEFIVRERLPASFQKIVAAHYLPLASWILQMRRHGEPLFIGINGAQGTGKSTLAAFLKFSIESCAGWHVAVLSLDDFYLTKAERINLSKRVHTLLATRGVPGTHDLQMLQACVERLKSLGPGAHMPLPRFEKSSDDRAKSEAWPTIQGTIDLVILEGWCVGSAPQSADQLLTVINSMEEQQDATGEWRQFVNDQLAGDYAVLFAQLDALIFLRAPDFDAVYRWRLEQERKLATVTSGSGPGIMNKEQITDFIQHYERITRANLKMLPETADVVLDLDTNHDCVRSHYATSSK